MQRPLVEDIRDRLDEFTAKERKAAHALLANYPLQGLGTVAQFAKEAGVSSPSILRFVSRLGFDSFSDFQDCLRKELASQLNSPLARSTELADGDVGDPFVSSLLDNVRETFEHMPKGELEGLSRLLADDRKNLYLIGGRFTDSLARYMAAHLRIVRANVHHVSGQQANWQDLLISIGPKDVVLVFDIRRYQSELINFADAAADRGATLALITDSWVSPIARTASFVLPARVAVNTPWDSSLALMAIAEVLIAGVTQQNPERSRERMQILEDLRETRAPRPDITGKDYDR
ncbi:transcriptional regulator [Roseibium sp. TrichSKD4]|uniref:MurR/RpiR family transcriptional regulator n=1 Tax=Roseibium sp. TrichSKD4 TaxID=744980 RepID=UPI0001E57301|nr:MurR/RpiR family transcriptional regulator [Roseibium sp. TrichSKD4]EFO28521.1 transcriptional regulator [Roseibium sp. TrichSKD4]